MVLLVIGTIACSFIHTSHITHHITLPYYYPLPLPCPYQRDSSSAFVRSLDTDDNLSR